jgi:hypothetical protein
MTTSLREPVEILRYFREEKAAGWPEAEAAFDAAIAALSTPPAEGMRESLDAQRWRYVANKAWFVDAVSNVFDLRDGSFNPIVDADDATANIDAAMIAATEGE